jgi:hypothetical protein
MIWSVLESSNNMMSSVSVEPDSLFTAYLQTASGYTTQMSSNARVESMSIPTVHCLQTASRYTKIIPATTPMHHRVHRHCPPNALLRTWTINVSLSARRSSCIRHSARRLRVGKVKQVDRLLISRLQNVPFMYQHSE